MDTRSAVCFFFAHLKYCSRFRHCSCQLIFAVGVFPNKFCWNSWKFHITTIDLHPLDCLMEGGTKTAPCSASWCKRVGSWVSDEEGPHDHHPTGRVLFLSVVGLFFVIRATLSVPLHPRRLIPPRHDVKHSERAEQTRSKINPRVVSRA